MTATTPHPSSSPVIPRGSQEVFWGLGGVAFLAMVLCLVAYRVFGAQLTAGLDQACAQAAFEAGQKFEADGNLAQAVVKYRQAMEGRFESEEDRYMCGRAIGDLLHRQGLYQDAVEAYEALPPAAFTHSGAYTGYVESLRRIDRLDAAAERGQTWLEMAETEGDTTQQTWAHYVLMHVGIDRGNPESALKHGQAVLALDPGNDAALTVARILREQGKYDAARAQVETMLKHTESPSLNRSGRALLEQLAREGALRETP